MSEASLAVRPAAPIERWREADWQRLWLRLRSRNWRSLAILPAAGGASVDFALRVAVTLSRTGMLHLGAPVQVADATRVPLSHLASFSDEVERCTASGDVILVAVGALTENPVALSLAQASDAALLCVLLEQMSFGDARNTVAQVGAAHFIGSAIFHPDGLPASLSL